jgi:hypothetical protein
MNFPSSPIADPVFYVPGKQGLAPMVVDMAMRQPDGTYTSRFSQKTYVMLANEYPGLEIGELDAVIKEKEDIYRNRPPVEITEESFQQALECLPPENWTNQGDTESFVMCEHTCGRITGIYVRIDDKFYTFSDLSCITHVEIVAKVRTAIAAGSVEQLQ